MVHQVLAHKNKRRKEENLFEIFSFVQKNRNSSRNFHDLDPHLYPDLDPDPLFFTSDPGSESRSASK